MYKLIATSNEAMRKYEGEKFELQFAYGSLWATQWIPNSGFMTSEVRIDMEYNGLRVVVTQNSIYVFRKEEIE